MHSLIGLCVAGGIRSYSLDRRDGWADSNPIAGAFFTNGPCRSGPQGHLHKWFRVSHALSLRMSVR